MFGKKKTPASGPISTVLLFLGFATCVFGAGMAMAPELIVTFLPIAFIMMGAIFLAIGWMAARS